MEPSQRPRTHPDWAFVLAGFASQLASAYFDMIRGPLMPAVTAALHLEFTQASWFLAVGSLVSFFATLTMIWALNRFSERAVMMVGCAVGLVAGAAAPAVAGLSALLALGGALGMAVSLLGTMANVLVVEGSTPKLRSRLLAGQHAMYGLGSMMAAWAVGWALGQGARWAQLYAAALPLYGLLLLFALFRLGHRAAKEQRTIQSPKLTGPQLLVVLTFAVYCAGEVSTSLWLTSYLVGQHHWTVSAATTCLTCYFLALMLARLACAALARPAWEGRILYAALLVPLAAFAVGYFGDRPAVFALMGLYGPFFPVFLGRAARMFPDKWRSLTILTLVGLQISCCFANLALGRLADVYGLHVAFLLPPSLLLGAVLLLTLHFRQVR